MKHYYLYCYRLFFLSMAVFLANPLFAQTQSVSGIVTDDATGEAIPGVNILLKGTTTGTVTDVDGQYQLNVPEGATLVFSSVGFTTEEVPVQGRAIIDISLVQDIQSLSEVIVVGYGTQERAKVTAAISTVSSEEISALPVTSIDQALQGRASGITVSNTGSPGVNPLVRIRGLGTIGNNDPFYVIDGMPSGGLNGINPKDIASIQILKDASASAIYGSRAANGVIIVTTKKGKKGDLRVNFDAYYGKQRAWKKLDLLNTQQYLQYGRRLLGDDNVPARFNDLGEFANINTDWQDEMFRTASIQDYNISVSGGGENSLFSIGGGHFTQEGIMLGTGFERYSFRANTEFTLGRLKIGETLILSRSERQNEPFNGGRSQIEHMIKMVPYIPVRDADRLGGFRGTDAVDGSDPENPVLNAKLRRNIDRNVKVLGTAYASFEILEGLEYKLLFGLDMDHAYNDQFTPIFDAGDYHKNPTADVSQNRTEYISPLITNQLSYDHSFGEHHISAVAVYEKQTQLIQNTGGGGETGLTSDLDVLQGLESPTIQGTRNEYAIISYIGRLNYDFAGKYLLSASFRRDGSSRFGPDYKWGTFPSFSVGWRISEEAFLSNISFISNIKLRGSWGQVGNDAFGNYRYQATLDNQFPYILGGVLVPGFTTRALANLDIKWENTTMTNVGLDLGLLNSSIRASLEYFHNETNDVLLPVPVPPSLGYDIPPVANVGSIVNKGFELSAGYTDFEGSFQWSLDGNLTFVDNELLSLGTGNAVKGQTFEGYATTNTEVGQPIGYFYGWVVDGIFQSVGEVEQANALDGDSSTPYQSTSTSPGDIRFKDLNGDGFINDDDRTNIGHYLPDFSYGLNASANYKNFDLTLFLQGVSGNEILNTNLYDLQGMTRLFNASTAVLDSWTPSNTDTDIPRAVSSDPNGNSRISTRYIEDGSYMRIKNLTLGYSLPETALNSFGNGFIRNLRVYVTAQNLLTITDYSGYDPEIGVRRDMVGNAGSQTPSNNTTLNAGVDYGQYPQARTFLVGIQLGF